METIIHLAYGLPGSGKTTLLSKIAKEKKKIVISYDEFKENSYYRDYSPEELRNEFFKKVAENLIYFKLSIADILITEKSELTKFFAKIDSSLKKIEKTNVTVKYVIHYFKCDREVCKHNDYNRRVFDSIKTIETKPFDILTPNYITSLNRNIELIEYNIQKKEQIEYLCNKVKAFDGILRSPEVHTGGYNGGNCWDDTAPSYYKHDDLPDKTDFEQLISFVEEVAVKTVPFSAWRYIFKHIVTVNEKTEYEYYGNSSDYAWYEANTKEVLDFLKSQDLC